MTHPVVFLHRLTDSIQKINGLLLEKKNNKATILAMLPDMLEKINEASSGFFKHENAQNEEHQRYFDEVIFEFATDSEFEDGIHRHLKGYLMDMKDIKNWIDSERRLMNKNEEYLHARITLIDYDPEYTPDSEKLENKE
jgi:uncharacterized protein YdiU (UPF0061 family)